jgi:hypothetical protein
MVKYKDTLLIKLLLFLNTLLPPITDLIVAVVELLGRDKSRLVVEVREVLEPVEP